MAREKAVPRAMRDVAETGTADALAWLAVIASVLWGMLSAAVELAHQGRPRRYCPEAAKFYTTVLSISAKAPVAVLFWSVVEAGWQRGNTKTL